MVVPTAFNIKNYWVWVCGLKFNPRKKGGVCRN